MKRSSSDTGYEVSICIEDEDGDYTSNEILTSVKDVHRYLSDHKYLSMIPRWSCPSLNVLETALETKTRWHFYKPEDLGCDGIDVYVKTLGIAKKKAKIEEAPPQLHPSVLDFCRFLREDNSLELHDFDFITNAVKEAKHRFGQRNKATLCEGTKVSFNSRGTEYTGFIEGIARKNATVRISTGIIGRVGKSFRVPLCLLTAI